MPSFKQFCLRNLNSGISALLPSPCPICKLGVGNTLLCVACHRQFFGQQHARCQRCAIPLQTHDNNGVCGECLSTPPKFDFTVVACDYVAPVDQLVLSFKFGHRLALGNLFSLLLRDALLLEPRRNLAELLCAVPLGKRRLSERGFNQSLEIAKPLSSNLGIALDPLLIRRTRETARQSSLHPDERQKNVRNSVMLNPHAIELIKGKHIGVIDDVMTTGATLQEIAMLLKRFGAAKVSNYVFARTPRH
jgi:ComF family protein